MDWHLQRVRLKGWKESNRQGFFPIPVKTDLLLCPTKQFWIGWIPKYSIFPSKTKYSPVNICSKVKFCWFWWDVRTLFEIAKRLLCKYVCLTVATTIYFYNATTSIKTAEPKANTDLWFLVSFAWMCNKFSFPV